MAMKTFSIQQQVYEKFSRFCKENGFNMSRQIELFMQSFADEEPIARKEYLEKLKSIRKGPFIKVKNLARQYGARK